MTIQLANLASAGDSPEDTEAVESYLAKKKERQPAKHTAGKWRMEERARRAEKRDFDCSCGFANSRSHELLFCCLLLSLVLKSDLTYLITTSMSSLAQASAFLLEAILLSLNAAAHSYKQPNPGYLFSQALL